MIAFRKGYFVPDAGAVYQDYETLRIGPIVNVQRVVTIPGGCKFSLGYLVPRPT